MQENQIEMREVHGLKENFVWNFNCGKIITEIQKPNTTKEKSLILFLFKSRTPPPLPSPPPP